MDSKLEGRRDGGSAPPDARPSDLRPPSDGPAGLPAVKLELLTPAIWPDGRLALEVHVANFALRPEKMGHPPAPGEGHYTVALDNGQGMRVDLPPGATLEYVLDFGAATRDALALPPGMYALVVILVDNLGTPLQPPVSAVAELELCGFDYASRACGVAPPPPACAPQDAACVPTCGLDPCPDCVQRKGCAPDESCVVIKIIDPALAWPGGKLHVELFVSWAPAAPNGQHRIVFEGPNATGVLYEGSDPVVDLPLPFALVPAQTYLLRAELVTSGGAPLNPPVEACWPIFVDGNASKPGG